jgi:hypothetical protein
VATAVAKDKKRTKIALEEVVKVRDGAGIACNRFSDLVIQEVLNAVAGDVDLAIDAFTMVPRPTWIEEQKVEIETSP